jgi:hypothetical protein
MLVSVCLLSSKLIVRAKPLRLRHEIQLAFKTVSLSLSLCDPNNGIADES